MALVLLELVESRDSAILSLDGVEIAGTVLLELLVFNVQLLVSLGDVIGSGSRCFEVLAGDGAMQGYVVGPFLKEGDDVLHGSSPLMHGERLQLFHLVYASINRGIEVALFVPLLAKLRLKIDLASVAKGIEIAVGVILGSNRSFRPAGVNLVVGLRAECATMDVYEDCGGGGVLHGGYCSMVGCEQTLEENYFTVNHKKRKNTPLAFVTFRQKVKQEVIDLLIFMTYPFCL
jgi:hypothetical protein